MAILHRATLTPSKRDLVERWLDDQPGGGAGSAEVVGSYRFDDPDGEVGVEALLVRRDDRVLHVPMTYRAAPLEGAEAHLVGTMEHSALGSRWVYEAAGDPVAVGCFLRALAGAQEQASLEVYDGDELVERRDPDVRIETRAGSSEPGELRLARALGDHLDGAQLLIARWAGGEAVVAAR